MAVRKRAHEAASAKARTEKQLILYHQKYDEREGGAELRKGSLLDEIQIPTSSATED
jgi:hypothetical protein